MKLFRHFLAAGAATVLIASTAAAIDLNVSGSTTVASAVMLPKEPQIEADAGLNIEIVANGSSRGIADLVNGDANVAMISAPLDVTIKKINKKDPSLLQGVDLVGHQIGETVVAFTVHPSNPVKSMTMEQVQGILSGSITNWSQLGGLDMPVVVVAETSGGGVRSLVESKLLNGASIAGTVREFPNATQVPDVSLQLPPAFGIAGEAAAMAAGARIMQTDGTISQPLILVTVGAPDADISRLIKAARAAGS